MSTRAHRGRLLVGLGVSLLVSAVWLWPQPLGGAMTVVSTYGSSMLPTYQPSDLVVVLAASTYDVDDVVAYRSGMGDGTILHRIVSEDDDGYILQGDNNDWLDPDRPTDDEILGTAWLRIPHAGRLLEVPPPVRAATVTGLAGLALFGGAARRRRRGRDRRRTCGSPPSFRHSPSSEPPRPELPDQETPTMSRPTHRSSTTSPTWAGWPGGTATGAGVLALAAGALLVIATVSPSTQDGEVSYAHQSTFDYTTAAPQGLVYPDGEVTTGEPVFLRLVDTLDLTYIHEVTTSPDAPTPAATADLTGRLWLEVSDGSGWSHRRPLGAEQQASREPLVIEERLAIPDVRNLVDEIREEAGVSGSSERIDVVAEVQAEGLLGDASFDDTLAPVLSFDVNEQRLSPRDGDDEVVGVSTEERTVTVDGVAPASLGLAGRSLQTDHAQVAGAAGVGLALLALLVATIAAFRHGRLDEPDRLRLQYGSRMVEVGSLRPPVHHGLVTVRDIATLAELADLAERPILHHADVAGHTYVVEDETTQFRYRVPAAATRGGDGDATQDAPDTGHVVGTDSAEAARNGSAESATDNDSAESAPEHGPDHANSRPEAHRDSGEAVTEHDTTPQETRATGAEPVSAPLPREPAGDSAESIPWDRVRVAPSTETSAAPTPPPAGAAATEPQEAAAPSASTELDIEGLERLFDERPTAPAAQADEAPTRPRARVSDDFFPGRTWSARN